MKEIFFVIFLSFQGQSLPPEQTKVESLEVCNLKVAEATAAMAEDVPAMNKDFNFIAGCMVVSKRANPA